jgi:hypothetical protein
VLSKEASWIASVRPPDSPFAYTIIVDKIIGKKVYIRDPWPLEGFDKGKTGVEGIMDINDFADSWAKGYNFMYKIKEQ